MIPGFTKSIRIVSVAYMSAVSLIAWMMSSNINSSMLWRSCSCIEMDYLLKRPPGMCVMNVMIKSENG